MGADRGRPVTASVTLACVRCLNVQTLFKNSGSRQSRGSPAGSQKPSQAPGLGKELWKPSLLLNILPHNFSILDGPLLSYVR